MDKPSFYHTHRFTISSSRLWCAAALAVLPAVGCLPGGGQKPKPDGGGMVTVDTGVGLDMGVGDGGGSRDVKPDTPPTDVRPTDVSPTDQRVDYGVDLGKDVRTDVYVSPGSGGAIPGGTGGVGGGGGSGGTMASCDTASYWVSTTGLDSNPGTEAQPFRTIQHAIDQLKAGGAILLTAGVYRERSLVVTHGGGNGQMLYICAQRGAEVVIDNGLSVPGWVAEDADAGTGVFRGTPVFADPAEKDKTVAVVVDGTPLERVLSRNGMTEGTYTVDSATGELFVWPAGGQAPKDTVVLNTGVAGVSGVTLMSESGSTTAPSNVVLNRLRIRGGEVGVRALSSSATGTYAGFLSLQQCTIEHTYREALRLEEYVNSTISNSEVRHSVLSNWPRGTLAMPTAAVLGVSANAIQVTNSSIHDNHGAGVRVQGMSHSWTLKHNKIHDNWGSNVHFDGVGDGQSIVANAIYNTETWPGALEGNRPEGIGFSAGACDTAGACTDTTIAGVTIFHNVIYNTRGGIRALADSIDGASSVAGFTVGCNTIGPMVGGADAILVRRASGVNVSGNIAYPGRIVVESSGGGVSASYNLVSSYSALQLSGPFTTIGQVVVGNPLFQGGIGPVAYLPSPGSPAIDSSYEDLCPPFDIEGTPRPQGSGWDIGAFEQ